MPQRSSTGKGLWKTRREEIEEDLDAARGKPNEVFGGVELSEVSSTIKFGGEPRRNGTGPGALCPKKT